MRIKYNKHKEEQLFHSVDKFYSGNGIMFTFLPHVAEEARTMIGNLVPYLKYRYKDLNLAKMFTMEAIVQYDKYQWDEATNGVKSAIEELLGEVVEFDTCHDLQIENIELQIRVCCSQDFCGIDPSTPIQASDDGSSIGWASKCVLRQQCSCDQLYKA